MLGSLHELDLSVIECLCDKGESTVHCLVIYLFKKKKKERKEGLFVEYLYFLKYLYFLYCIGDAECFYEIGCFFVLVVVVVFTLDKPFFFLIWKS